MKETTSILLNSKTSREAVRTLYHFTKAKRDHLSLTHILQKTGIPSRGYLSMVLNGKKTLGQKYLARMGKIFSLAPAEARYLEVLVQIELSKSKETIKKLEADLEKARLELVVTEKVLKSQFTSYALISEIFCSLSLFKQPPKLSEILALFPNRELLDVQSAIAELEKLGIVEKDSKTNAYKQLQTKVSWIRADDPTAVMRAFEEIFAQGIKDLPKYFPDREISFYNTSAVTAKWSEFVELLPRIREQIYTIENQMDREDADCLVRFNVQLYPVTKPSKS